MLLLFSRIISCETLIAQGHSHHVQVAAALLIVSSPYQLWPSRAAQQPAVWFVSHAWQGIFLDLLEALENFFARESPECIVCAFTFRRFCSILQRV
jgi:hypothetical protein